MRLVRQNTEPFVKLSEGQIIQEGYKRPSVLWLGLKMCIFSGLVVILAALSNYAYYWWQNWYHHKRLDVAAAVILEEVLNKDIQIDEKRRKAGQNLSRDELMSALYISTIKASESAGKLSEIREMSKD